MLMPNRRKNAQNCWFFSSDGEDEDDDRLGRERVRVGDSVASLMVCERPLPPKNGKRSERPEVFESRAFNHSWKKEHSKNCLRFGCSVFVSHSFLRVPFLSFVSHVARSTDKSSSLSAQKTVQPTF